jgi:hypothetical protein
LEVGEESCDHLGFFDAREDFKIPTTVGAVLEVDAEHPLQSPCPAYRHVPWRGGVALIRALKALDKLEGANEDQTVGICSEGRQGLVRLQRRHRRARRHAG